MSKSDYQKLYQATRAKATTELVNRHKDEFNKIFAGLKREAGLPDQSERSAARKREQFVRMAQDLGVDPAKVEKLL